MDNPYQDAGISFSELATRSTARRLRRTRQNLGTYRHDLLIAMRVVNNVEREMLRAEWENWLLDENTRCKQVQWILRENKTKLSSSEKGKAPDFQLHLDSKEKDKMEVLRQWQEEYCGSCKREQELLLDGKKTLAFA
jgi:hypothetical protein